MTSSTCVCVFEQEFGGLHLPRLCISHVLRQHSSCGCTEHARIFNRIINQPHDSKLKVFGVNRNLLRYFHSEKNPTQQHLPFNNIHNIQDITNRVGNCYKNRHQPRKTGIKSSCYRTIFCLIVNQFSKSRDIGPTQGTGPYIQQDLVI